MDIEVDKKFALVTGASSGIGRAFVKLLAQKNYNLVIVARNGDELNRLAGVEMTNQNCTIIPVIVDLTTRDAGEKLQSELDERGISPDLLVNNAGFGLTGRADKLDRVKQLKLIDLNIRVLSDLSLRFLPAMVERNQGGIINISSVAAYAPGPYMACYYASKAYVQSFSLGIAQELKATKVTITAVAPGPVDTGFQDQADMKLPEWIFKLPGIRTAEEVALDAWSGYLRGDRVVLPGIVASISAKALALMPAFMSMPLIARMQKPKAFR